MTWTHERIRPKNWNGNLANYKQFKFNGHRFTVFKQEDGTLVGFERDLRPDREITVRYPDFVKYDWWKQLQSLPPMTSVDGELHIIGGNAGDAAHAIAECSDNLEFAPFAVPWFNSVDHRSERLSLAAVRIKEYTDLIFAPFFNMTTNDTQESLCKDAIDLDIEGWVLKNANYTSWWKVKPTKDIDVIVTGFKDGDGKFLGLVGALKCSLLVNGEMHEIASVSGMDDETRLDIDEKKDLNRVCEVEYQHLGNGHRLIHPRFIRWRDDKPFTECCVDSWEDL